MVLDRPGGRAVLPAASSPAGCSAADCWPRCGRRSTPPPRTARARRTDWVSSASRRRAARPGVTGATSRATSPTSTPRPDGSRQTVLLVNQDPASFPEAVGDDFDRLLNQALLPRLFFFFFFKKKKKKKTLRLPHDGRELTCATPSAGAAAQAPRRTPSGCRPTCDHLPGDRCAAAEADRDPPVPGEVVPRARSSTTPSSSRGACEVTGAGCSSTTGRGGDEPGAPSMLLLHRGCAPTAVSWSRAPGSGRPLVDRARRTAGLAAVSLFGRTPFLAAAGRARGGRVVQQAWSARRCGWCTPTTPRRPANPDVRRPRRADGLRRRLPAAAHHEESLADLNDLIAAGPRPTGPAADGALPSQHRRSRAPAVGRGRLAPVADRRRDFRVGQGLRPVHHPHDRRETAERFKEPTATLARTAAGTVRSGSAPTWCATPRRDHPGRATRSRSSRGRPLGRAAALAG